MLQTYKPSVAPAPVKAAHYRLPEPSWFPVVTKEEKPTLDATALVVRLPCKNRRRAQKVNTRRADKQALRPLKGKQYPAFKRGKGLPKAKASNSERALERTWKVTSDHCPNLTK